MFEGELANFTAKQRCPCRSGRAPWGGRARPPVPAMKSPRAWNILDCMAENASDPRAPVFDAWALTTLAEELGGERALNFAGRWSQLLPRRIEGIREAINARDVHAGLDAVRSLKVSSSAVGAQQLAGIAASLEREVSHQDWIAAEPHALHLPDAATRAVEALEVYRATL